MTSSDRANRADHPLHYLLQLGQTTASNYQQRRKRWTTHFEDFLPDSTHIAPDLQQLSANLMALAVIDEGAENRAAARRQQHRLDRIEDLVLAYYIGITALTLSAALLAVIGIALWFAHGAGYASLGIGLTAGGTGGTVIGGGALLAVKMLKWRLLLRLTVGRSDES